MWRFPCVDGVIRDSKKTQIKRCKFEEVARVCAYQTTDHSSREEIIDKQKLGNIVNPLREDVGHVCPVV